MTKATGFLQELLVSADHMPRAVGLLSVMETPFFQDTVRGAGVALAAAASDDFWTELGDEFGWLRPYQVVDGVLVIPVMGMLLNNFPYQFSDYATGYEYVTAAVRRGIEDPAVTGIVLRIDSPGGYVSGCFDCADVIYGARGTKPIRAVAAEMAASAAYALASAADTITVARTGYVGSIGVIRQHLDVTAWLERAGFKVTLIYAGDQKADGYPEKPMDDAQKARAQAQVDVLYQIFVSTVARNRGLAEEAVRATEAGIFLGQQGVEAGLADAVGSFDAELEALISGDPEASLDDNPSLGDDTMTTPQNPAPAPAPALDAAAVARAEQTRIATILDSEDGKARPALARHLAFNTTMSPDEAKVLLAVKEVAAAPAPTPAPAPAPAPAAANPFAAAMDGTPNPNLGAAPAPAANQPQGSKADAIFASAGFRPRT